MMRADGSITGKSEVRGDSGSDTGTKFPLFGTGAESVCLRRCENAKEGVDGDVEVGEVRLVSRTTMLLLVLSAFDPHMSIDTDSC